MPASFLFFFVLKASGAALSPLDCVDVPEISPLLELAREKPSPQDPALRYTEFEKKCWETSQVVAHRIFLSYISGRWSSQKTHAIELCRRDRNLNLLAPALQREFFESTLKRLAQTHSKYIQAFVSVVRTEKTNLFRLYGQYEEKSITHGKGGFHRGSRSLFLDFGKIPSTEWMIIFAHEYLHSLDQRLTDAVQEYAKKENVRQFVEWSRGTSDPSLLSPEQWAVLQRWILAGLDRGFLAEQRAWTSTFLLYLEGRKENLWPQIDWLEFFLSQRRAGESLADLALRVLDPGFLDPTEGIFSVPLIQNALKWTRSQLREHRIRPVPAPLGCSTPIPAFDPVAAEKVRVLNGNLVKIPKDRLIG